MRRSRSSKSLQDAATGSTVASCASGARADRCRRAASIWAILEQQASLSGARELLVYRDTLSILPEDWARNPLHRELLLGLPIRDNGTAEPGACIAVAQRSGHSTEPDDPDRPSQP
jgi:hypothetical protein